jgi:hypothetical protein
VSGCGFSRRSASASASRRRSHERRNARGRWSASPSRTTGPTPTPSCRRRVPSPALLRAQRGSSLLDAPPNCLLPACLPPACWLIRAESDPAPVIWIAMRRRSELSPFAFAMQACIECKRPGTFFGAAGVCVVQEVTKVGKFHTKRGFRQVHSGFIDPLARASGRGAHAARVGGRGARSGAARALSCASPPPRIPSPRS